ncbi:MAG: hypothetical protein ACRDTC_06815 [Pseudonocardiaceae bacterium]
MRVLVLVMGLAIVAAMVPASAAFAAPSGDYSPERAAHNAAKSQERSRDHMTPQYQQLLLAELERAAGEGVQTPADPDRLYVTNLCGTGAPYCAGDVRLSRWAQDGHGLVEPVLYTARNGASISGHVWATRAGPARRTGVVITPGSVQASEPLYWWAAQVLAKAGYLVLTVDNQSQGRSDTFGAGPDFLSGQPQQATGETFFDGTQDGIDFLLSTPEDAYCPRPSRSGASHCADQQGRTAFNPFWHLVDHAAPVGLAGHSYGASGVSWVGQQDPRVGAVVAWDDLCDPTLPTQQLFFPVGTTDLVVQQNFPANCLAGGQLPAPRLRVPALGITADYIFTPIPFPAPPDPDAKARDSHGYSVAGVDTGLIVIRGGTHFEWSYLATPAFPATLRGIDLSAWYTTAWFDKYLRADRSADARLLTTRWQHDPIDTEVDPAESGNLFSWHYTSRLDLHLNGGERFRCENLRSGCPGMTTDDRYPTEYGYLPIATSPEIS